MDENAISSFKYNKLQTQTIRVVIFKDGYCMFVQKLTGILDAASKLIIKGIPEAMILGSFWVVPEREN